MTSTQGPTGTTTTPTSATTTDRGVRRLISLVVGITAVIALMLLAFAAPAINSGANDLPLAVSGPGPAVTQVTGALSSNRPGAFDVTTYPTAADAARAIGDRDAIGGIAVAPTGITIQTAAGAGAPYAPLLRGIGTQLAASGQNVTYEEVAPLTIDDPTGAGLTALGLPLIFGGLASAAALVLAYRGAVATRALTALALSVLAGFTVTAILQFGFGSFDGSYWLTATAVSAGIAAISLTVLGLGLLLGPAGIGLGAVLMLFVANPLSGMDTGPAWLPQPWGQIGQYLPLGAAGTTIRSAAYFDGNGDTTAWIVLGCWALAGLLLALLASRRTATTALASTDEPGLRYA